MSASRMLDVSGRLLGQWRRRAVFVLDGHIWIRNRWNRVRHWGRYDEWCDRMRDGRIREFQVASDGYNPATS